jgi:hypothetical protein
MPTYPLNPISFHRLERGEKGACMHGEAEADPGVPIPVRPILNDLPNPNSIRREK